MSRSPPCALLASSLQIGRIKHVELARELNCLVLSELANIGLILLMSKYNTSFRDLKYSGAYLFVHTKSTCTELLGF